MATIEQVKQVLATFGLSAPDFIIQAALDKVASVNACLVASYEAYDRVLIECYAAALIAGATGARQVSGHSAPSGASQSFKVSDSGMNDLRSALLALDKSGCTAAIIPPETGKSAAYFDVVSGV